MHGVSAERGWLCVPLFVEATRDLSSFYNVYGGLLRPPPQTGLVAPIVIVAVFVCLDCLLVSGTDGRQKTGHVDLGPGLLPYHHLVPVALLVLG